MQASVTGAGSPLGSAANEREFLSQILESAGRWPSWLPEDERQQMITEVLEAARGYGKDAGNPGIVITEWRSTAQVYADPELAEDMAAELPMKDCGRAPSALR